MTTRSLAFVALTLIATAARAQSPFRYDDDLSAYKNGAPSASSVDRLKYVPLGADPDIYLSQASIADIPLYDDDLRAAGIPPSVTRLQAAIASADAVLIATPEYNYSVPGALKNAIDWVSRTDPQPFADKPVAIMGASPSALGTGRAQYDLRKMFVYLDAHLLNKPEVMISAAQTRFDADGRLTDETTRKLIAGLLAALRDWTRRLQGGA